MNRGKILWKVLGWYGERGLNILTRYCGCWDWGQQKESPVLGSFYRRGCIGVKLKCMPSQTDDILSFFSPRSMTRLDTKLPSLLFISPTPYQHFQLPITIFPFWFNLDGRRIPQENFMCNIYFKNLSIFSKFISTKMTGAWTSLSVWKF